MPVTRARNSGKSAGRSPALKNSALKTKPTGENNKRQRRGNSEKDLDVSPPAKLRRKVVDGRKKGNVEDHGLQTVGKETTKLGTPQGRQDDGVDGGTVTSLSTDLDAASPGTTGDGSEHERGKDGGLVSNGSLEEGEVEAFCAPEDALEEEARLRSVREAEEKEEMERKSAAEASAEKGEGGILEDGKYAQLDKLLDQSKLYTQFLSEQMNTSQEITMDTAHQEAIKKKSQRKGAKKTKEVFRGRCTYSNTQGGCR